MSILTPHLIISYTVKTLYTGILYNGNILYNVIGICTNVPVQLDFEFITLEIQFNVKLFGHIRGRCREGCLAFMRVLEKRKCINIRAAT